MNKFDARSVTWGCGFALEPVAFRRKVPLLLARHTAKFTTRSKLQ